MIPKSRSLMVLLAMLVPVACSEDSTAPTSAINLNPATVSFSAAAGGDNPAVQTVAVTNTGGGSLTGLTVATTYGAGQPTGWLNATLDQTTGPATLTLTPTLSPTGGALAEGSYTANVAIASPGARNTPQNVAVTFNVAAAAGHTFVFTPPAGAPAITSVHVPGEFNGWDENGSAMTLQGGTWRVTVPLAAGRYEYKYRINGNWINNMCNDPTFGSPAHNFRVDINATGCEDDPFGGANAFIVIN
jgi:hypothetical protein